LLSWIIIFSSISLNNLIKVNATISGPDWEEKQDTIYSYKDSFVFKNASERNYGNNINFIVGNLTDYNLANGTGSDFCEAYFFFNLRNIKSLEKISSITFSFFGESFNNEKIPIEVYTVSALWDELTIVWNNKPALSSFIDIIDVDVLSLYEFNITQEALGKNSISISLRAPKSDVYFLGVTNESSNPNKPRLFVNYLVESVTVDGTDLDFLAILLISAISLVAVIFIVSLVSGRSKSKSLKKKRNKPISSSIGSGIEGKIVSLQTEIAQMKNLQDDLSVQAKQAEKENMYNLAAEYYGKCKDLALNLFKYGVKGQSDLIKKYSTLETKYAISHEFNKLNQTLNGLTGEQFSGRLQAIMNLIVERKRTSSILQNLKRWVEDYQTKSATLSEFDKRQIGKAIEFWKQF